MKSQITDPSYYRDHPSGVECIDICDNMSFSLGNAFKYLFRCGKKGLPIDNLNKALWYLHREMDYLKVSWWRRWIHQDYVVHLEAPDSVQLVLKTELRYSGHMAAALGWIWTVHESGRKDHILHAIKSVERMVKMEEARNVK